MSVGTMSLMRVWTMTLMWVRARLLMGVGSVSWWGLGQCDDESWDNVMMRVGMILRWELGQCKEKGGNVVEIWGNVPVENWDNVNVKRKIFDEIWDNLIARIPNRKICWELLGLVLGHDYDGDHIFVKELGQHCQELRHLFDGTRANTKRGQCWDR